MSIWEAILLGLVQGLTEFLPVSSSGHLILVQAFFGIESPGVLLEILMHVGTLAAVMFVFWRDIFAMLKKPFSKPVYLLVLATIPAVLATLLLGDFMDTLFAGKLLGVGFLLTALALTWADFIPEKKGKVGYRNALIMGLAQALAIMPGLSRSGSTIVGGLFSGVDRRSAAKFSFLMSIVAIFGSTVLSVKDLFGGGLEQIGVLPVLFGVLAAALSSLFSVKFMLRIIQKVKFRCFAVYVGLIGILTLLDQLVFHLVL